MITPAIYINTRTKQFAIFQDRATSHFVIRSSEMRQDMLDNGFEYFCTIVGDSSVVEYKEWTQVDINWTPIKSSRADALAYAEALVLIIKNGKDKA